MPNFFDQFDTPSGAAPTPPGFTGTRMTVQAGEAPAAKGGNFFDQFDTKEPNFLGMTSGLYKAADAGIAQGVAGLIGLPSAVADLGAAGIDKATRGITSALGIDYQRPDASGGPNLGSLVTGQQNEFPTKGILPTSEQAQGAIQRQFYGGAAPYEPQTPGEHYMKGGAEFVPGAVLGPGGMVGNAIRYGVLPGLAATGAGDIPGIKGTALEQPAKVLAALLTGGFASLASRPGSAAKAIREFLPPGINEQNVLDAHQLIMRSANLPGGGVPLTWSEALSQVTGRPVLSDLTRHLEAAAPTQGRMADFYAGRPQQVEGAARGTFDTVAPRPTDPSMIGPAVGEAATQTLDRIRGAINQATRPSYDAARQSLVPQNVHAAMMADPLFANTLNELRTNAELAGPYRGLSDRSSIVYDGVKKQLETRAQNLRNPINPNASNEAAANVGTMGDTARRIAVAADRNAMGLAPGAPGVGNLERALAEQAQLRQQYLEPAQRGPLGRMGNDPTTNKAVEAVFGSESKQAGSEHEIFSAVSALTRRNPRAAEALVRAHAEATFDNATKDLIGGARQSGGANFRTQLVGHPQDAANFEAAVMALPHGAERMAGFDRLLETMQAIGTRQNVGSKTAYNAEFLKGQAKSGIPGEVVKGGLNPLQATRGLLDKYEQWRLGRNLNELADILTNPAAVAQLRAISRMPPGSRQAEAIALRLATLTRSATNTEPVNQTRQ
jgi:hypothetical protein